MNYVMNSKGNFIATQADGSRNVCIGFAPAGEASLAATKSEFKGVTYNIIRKSVKTTDETDKQLAAVISEAAI